MTILIIIGSLILLGGIISTLRVLYYLLSGNYEIDQRINKFL